MTSSSAKEIWKSIPDYLGYYEASSLGRVRSTARYVNGYSHNGACPIKIKRKSHILSQNVRGAGYLYVCLSFDGLERKEQVHKLVLLAFKGKCPYGMQACHNDGNPKHNNPDNLRWDTPKNNQLDRKRHNTDLRGEEVGTSKYKAEDIIKIKNGIGFKEANSEFGISRTQFYRIKKGEAWCHI